MNHILLLKVEGKPVKCFFDLDGAKKTYAGPPEFWKLREDGVWYNVAIEAEIMQLPLELTVLQQMQPAALRVPTPMKDYRRGLLRLLETVTLDRIAAKIQKPREWIIEILNTEYD